MVLLCELFPHIRYFLAAILQRPAITGNMLSFFSQAAIFFIVLFCLAYVRIYRATSYLGGCPRVGRPGVLGYIIEALRFTLDSESVILEGKASFSNKPFVIPTLVDYISAPF